MTADNVTSIDADAAPLNRIRHFKSPRGILPEGVTLQGMTWTAHDGRLGVSLIYRGTKEALIAAGCITPSMLEACKTRRSKHDEFGAHYWLHRSPTKAAPRRMKLCRNGGSDFAMQLPGMREMFPEGFPEPPQIETQRSAPADAETWWAATADEWKEKEFEHLDMDHRVNLKLNGERWRGLNRRLCGPRFRLADADIRSMEAVMDRFSQELNTLLEQAEVIDTQASPARGSFLRLVVNNELETSRR